MSAPKSSGSERYHQPAMDAEGSKDAPQPEDSGRSQRGRARAQGAHAEATADPVYDPIAAFASRLAHLGVTDVVISPGSRSTPLTLSFDSQPGLTTWIQLDERSAGFFALGLGRATGRPAVLVCTSGTAAANYLPAVIEASHGGVPLIVCTADRPPELRSGWGAPQTINQINLYGTAVRLAVDVPVASEITPSTASEHATKALEAATGADPGPVHVNWPLREPLEPVSETWSTSAGHRHPQITQNEGPQGSSDLPAADAAGLIEVVARHHRGVVVAGPWPGGGLGREREWADATVELAAWAGWPVIADPLSGVRGASGVVATADHLLADHGSGHEMRPDVALLVGRPVTTKPVRLWLERTRPEHVVLIDPEDRWETAVFRLTGHVAASVDTVLARVTQRTTEPVTEPTTEPAGRVGVGDTRTASSGSAPPAPVKTPAWRHDERRLAWRNAWQDADATARKLVAQAVDRGPMLSAQVARTMVATLHEHAPRAVLFASNSMPVRDLDAFIHHTAALSVVANRGAAGIDGVPSTALGLAAADPSVPVVLYTGDLALLHDLGGLTAAERLGLHLTVVCVDNDGGEIFSLLPIAKRLNQTDFRRLFHTPHGLRFVDLHGFGGIRAVTATDASTLEAALKSSLTTRQPGVDLVIVPVDPEADVTQRRSLTAAVTSGVQQQMSTAQAR